MNTLFDISGRCALVTGASSGLGRHFAKTLAMRGAKVAVAARRLDRLDTLVAEISAAGGTAAAVSCDVTDAASVRAAIGTAEEALGPIGILVNNAGVTVAKPLLEQDEDDWRRVIDTNLNGAWRVSQAVARRMTARGSGGSIVNIASIAGIGTMASIPAYVASKAGLIQLTKTMAAELAPNGVRVNAIAPGFFPSELSEDYLATERGRATIARIPMSRVGELGELDGPLLLLVSGAGSFMTGAVLVVDGGALVGHL